MTAATDQLTTEAQAAMPACVVCGANAHLANLNEQADGLRTPSLAPDYYACADAASCIERALKAAAELVKPDSTEPDTDEPDTDEPGD